MAELNLPNIRKGGDITFRVGLEDGGVAVDWSALEEKRAFLFSDEQRLVSGECTVAVDPEDSTVLVCQYSGDDRQHAGVNSVVVRAKYRGRLKVYDKKAVNIVGRTSAATGVLEIEDPVVPVQLSVEDVSTSLLDGAIDAALAAAAEAEHAAHLIPNQVLLDCEAATAAALNAASKAPYIDETTGRWFVWDAQAGEYVDSGKTAKGDTGNGIASWSVVESQEDDGNNVVTVTFTDGTSETFNVKNGKTGNGIASIVQTVESPDDAGTNVITITMTNGTVVTFDVKNGSKGQPGAAQAAYKSVDTLPTASAATMDKIYLTPSGTTGVYNMSYTDYDGSAYSWVDLGTTAIQLSDYATKAEVTQLEAKVDDLSTGKYYGYFAQDEDLPDADVDGFAYVGEGPTYTIYNLRGGVWTSSDITVNQSPIGNDEDIDQNEDGKLQFADRTYNAQQPNGMGYKILRKDATFASQVTDTNTIYEIRYPFTLSSDFTMPPGCVLKFNGGRIEGSATLSGNGTTIDAGLVQIFGGGISFAGTWMVKKAFVEWCGTRADDVTDFSAADSANTLQSIADIIVFQEGTYQANTTLNLSKCLLGKNKGRNLSIGTTIVFYPAADNFVCVQIGDDNGSVLTRINEVKVENIALYTAGEATRVGGSVVTISYAGQVSFNNCSIQNRDVRGSEFLDAELNDAPSYCGYAVRCKGSSEFIRFVKVGFLGDICFYSDGASLDFTSFIDCVFAAGTYGFGGFYVSGSFTNPELFRCSFNQGIYGMYFNGAEILNLNYSGGRIEQLRNKSVNGSSITCAVRVILGNSTYNTRRQSMLLSSVFFPMYRAVCVSGDEQFNIVLDGCGAFNLSNAVPLIDIESAKGVYIKAVGCAMLAQTLVKYTETQHTVNGLRLRNQQNASYAGTIHNLELIPTVRLANIRNDFHSRIIASSNRMYSYTIDEEVTQTSRVFVDRVKLWDNDNKCIGYKLELEAFAPSIYAKAIYYVKYGYSGGVIDPTSGSISLIEHSGDDIFDTVTTTGKLALYISSSAGAAIQVSISNSTGSNLHISGRFTAITNVSLITS